MSKIFDFFDSTKEGKGIKKGEIKPEKIGGFGHFFLTLGRKFWNFSMLNFMYVINNFPIFFALFAFAGSFDNKLSAPTNLFFPQLFGIQQHASSPAISAFAGVLGTETVLSFPTNTTLIFYALSLLCLLTFGISNAGSAYVLREYSKSEPVYLFNDYVDAIKRNYKQAIPLGIIDIVICFASFYMLSFWSAQTGFINNMMYYFAIFVAFVYFFMRMYMYVILVTFELSLFKILKNSFIFALVGLKRNVMALIGIAITLLINVYLFFFVPMIGYILPFIITISLVSFISVYAAYPNIKKIMIDPYYKRDTRSDVEPIFTDRG